MDVKKITSNSQSTMFSEQAFVHDDSILIMDLKVFFGLRKMPESMIQIDVRTKPRFSVEFSF